MYANKLFNYGYRVLNNYYKQFEEAISERYKYVYKCSECGKEFPSQRRLNTDRWKCSCHGHLYLKED